MRKIANRIAIRATFHKYLQIGIARKAVKSDPVAIILCVDGFSRCSVSLYLLLRSG